MGQGAFLQGGYIVAESVDPGPSGSNPTSASYGLGDLSKLLCLSESQFSHL